MKKHTHTKDARENILTAFLLNFGFVIFELAGGLYTGSVAILSDSIHDLGDCIAIGSAYFLERFSRGRPTESYTYGYRRYSIVSAIISSLVLLAGSGFVVYSSVERLINPAEPKSGIMILLAIFGVIVNGYAAYRTHSGSFNERAISLHMLEDVLGWAVVLVGSIVMYIFRGNPIALYVDPVMSLLVAAFIIYNIIVHLRGAFSVLLERAPVGFDTAAYKAELAGVEGVLSVHHLHVWSFDGESAIATLHAVVPADYTIADTTRVKHEIYEISEKFGIDHLTVQTDAEGDRCYGQDCRIGEERDLHRGHHH
ncbi:MAG: cation transporter [Clostridiales bacterium]|nr:cation transporter [Clostridiales bacterium]